MTKTNALEVGALTPRASDARAHAFGLRICTCILEGARTAYIDEGTGPVVLLLHGAPVTSLGFARVVRALRSTHRVIAPDLPGFGGSELPERFGGSLEEYTRFIVAFVERLGIDRFILYVNDASGCVGLAAGTRFSPGALCGLVVASTVPIPLTGAAWLVGLLLRHIVASRWMRWVNRRLNLLPWLVATAAPWLKPFAKAERTVLTREFNTPDKRERVLDLLEQIAIDEPFLRSTARAAREELAHVPTLILYGQFDPMRIIGGVARFREMFPRSQLAIIPWEEHFPILASGERVANTMRNWMKTLPAAAHG